MLIFKIKFSFSFFFDFDFLFLCFFSFSLFLVVVSLLGCFMLIVNGCVVLIFTTFFLLKYGKTALHIAAWEGFEEIVKILIEHRSNINIQDKVLIFFFFFSFNVFLLEQLRFVGLCDGWWVVGMRGWWRDLK